MEKNYSETLYQVFLNVGFAISSFYIVLLLFTLLNQKYFKRKYIYFLWLFTGYALFENSYLITRSFELKNELFVDHIYFFFGTIIQGLIYYHFTDSPRMKNFIKVVVPIFLSGIILTAIYKEGYKESPILLPVRYFVFIVFYLFLHRQLINSARPGFLREQPIFWFNLGFLLWAFYAIIFGLINKPVMYASNNASFVLHIVGSILDYFCVILWLIGIYKLRKWHSKPALA